ncbi:CRISPR-associated RAMP protein Csx7 [Nostoc sp. 106C]|uniref:type III CRISPR-associated RAMP protein Csx7 n=1 Tax=Nostoc sp. 106C TaxID=1932667 RepID=UPI001AA1C21B|nr:CRISPR-associated RAMP protein Csx7 [Nostoc sp. 106C]
MKRIELNIKVRSRLESFLRGIDPKFAANPALESEWSIPPDEMSDFKNSINNLANQAKEERLHQYIIDNTDLVSFLSGSPWLASKSQVRDLTVLADSWFGQYQERDGVVIERDTETAGDGKLYDFQVVPAGTPFEFRAVVDICDRLIDSQQFPSPEGQLFNHHLELRWKKQGELYKVLLLTTLKLEPGFEPVGKNWEFLDRNAHQYSATDSRFPQGFTSDDVKIAQRYFRDSSTATVHFVALTIPK